MAEIGVLQSENLLLNPSSGVYAVPSGARTRHSRGVEDGSDSSWILGIESENGKGGGEDYE